MENDLLQHLDRSVRSSLRNKEYSSINHFLHTVESLEKPLSAISLPKAAPVEREQVYKDITRELRRTVRADTIPEGRDML